MIYKHILALFGLLLGGSLEAMTKSDYKPYYIKGNLTSLDKKGQRRHAAMKILIDEQNKERVDSNNAPFTSELVLSLQDESFPLIISAHLLKNLLIRTRTYDPSNFHSQNKRSTELKEHMDKVKLVSSQWELYDVPQSQFILLIPKDFSYLFQGKNLGLKQLSSLDKLIPENDQNQKLTDYPYKELIDWLEQNKKIIPFSPKDLDQIFISNSDATPIWDFYIGGHGEFEPSIIANLSPAALNSMLSFFDNKIKTGIIYVSSCYAGGKNRTLLETTKDGVQTNHNFIIIIGSIADSIVISQVQVSNDSLSVFFNNAGFIQDKGDSVNNLLNQLTSFVPTPQAPHGATGIPQVWFPGGYGFQTPNIGKQVLSLGNVFVTTHKENNQPIAIENKIVTLVYPSVIDVPLRIQPFSMGFIVKKEWHDFPLVYEPNFFVNIDLQTQKKILDQLKTEGALPPYLYQLPELAHVQNASNPNYYLYPQFISMMTPYARHSFSNISISTKIGNQQVAQGVLQFIREGFFDATKANKQNYFIDTLTGDNDISLTLAASRLLSNTQDKHALEQLLQDRANKEITLKNVMLQAPDWLIAFQVDGIPVAWLFTRNDFSKDPTKEMRWNFWPMDPKEYEELYKANKQKLIAAPAGEPSQKSITEILKQKHAEIMLKKAVELKKKQEALKEPAKSTPDTKPAPVTAAPKG